MYSGCVRSDAAKAASVQLDEPKVETLTSSSISSISSTSLRPLLLNAYSRSPHIPVTQHGICDAKKEEYGDHAEVSSCVIFSLNQG